MQLAVVRGHAVQRADGQAMHGQRAMGDTDAFRTPGGTRGVNQVSEVLRVVQVAQVGARQMRHGLTVQFQHRHPCHLWQ